MESDLMKGPKPLTDPRIEVNFELKINDFSTKFEFSEKEDVLEHPDTNLYGTYYFSAGLVDIAGSICSEGIECEDCEGEWWILVGLYVEIKRGNFTPRNSNVQYVINVVDIEGNKRFPRTFQLDHFKNGRFGRKYLERSFILRTADELLDDGVLTLSCDICFHWFPGDIQIPALIPEAVMEQFDSESRYPPLDYPKNVLSGVIYTEGMEVRALEFHSSSWSCKNFCTIETIDKSYNLSLDGVNDLGCKLQEASLPFRQCLSLPMDKYENKAIKLPHTDGQTFLNVLYFISKGALPKLEFTELVKIYEFSDMFLMAALQRNCAEDMVNGLQDESVYNQLQEMANRCGDKYLKQLLEDRSYVCENLTEMYIK